MLVKEISKDNGAFNYWNDEKIKGAFRNGHGTKEDFIEFMKNNGKYADFEIIEE